MDDQEPTLEERVAELERHVRNLENQLLRQQDSIGQAYQTAHRAWYHANGVPY